MPAVITNKFRIQNAAQFVESLSEASNNNIYFYMGGNTPFVDEFNPPSPGSAPANTDILPWLGMFGAKRIQPADVSHVAQRYNWVSGTTYSQYDDKNTNVLSSVFYVMTDEFNVYKCLFNNGNTPSINKPTGRSTSVITTSDGYKWKYMFTVSTSEGLKFLTANHIPVKKLTVDDGSDQWLVQSGAVNGAIDIVLIESPGSGYVTAPAISISGDGTGAQMTASVAAGQLTGITVVNRGSGYTNMNITFSGGGEGGGQPTAHATVRAIIPPSGGHGSDPIKELGGVYVLMNVRVDGNEANTFTTSNEFRQIGLIVDPRIYGSSTIATAPVYRQTFKYQLTGVSAEFTKDSVVTFGSNTAVVVDYQTVGANNFLYTTLPKPGLFQVGNNLTISGANGTISSIETPGLRPYSGDIIYIENRVAVPRSNDQIEDVKLIVEF